MSYYAGADLDAMTAKNWSALSYAKAKGKYGATEEKGIYPEVSDCCACDMIILHTHDVRLSTDSGV